MNKWTVEQTDAIQSKWRDEERILSSNILVNAAAGSGKTAVLVERIIRKLCADYNSPDFCDIDNILVVTFTNAAAKEMKQRISDALNQKLSDAISENDTLKIERLNSQIKKINQADITTIDSFCLKIVKNYFHLIDIDPNFRIADTPECELLKDESIEELFDAEYSNEKFVNLALMLTDGRDTKEIADIIKNLFKFTRSLPDPQKWYEEYKEKILITSEENILFKIVKDKIHEELNYAKNLLENALIIMVDTVYGNCEDLNDVISRNVPETENELYYAFGTYYTAMYNEYNIVTSMIGKKWDEMFRLIKDISFINLRTSPLFKSKDKLIKDKELLEELKNLRTSAKDAVLKAQQFIKSDVEEIINISRENTYPMISEIIDLCNKFEDIYTKKKQLKNALEFSDIEHMCLNIIRDNVDVKKELQQKYSEILIDEYQDTNSLQEEIFSSISQGDNMFMVGDMKQSIYRFRSSDPGIFKNKSDAYSKDVSAKNRKIVLSKNFRSRKSVLGSVNSVFNAVMSETVGEINYDDDQKLNCGNIDYVDKNEDFENAYKSECYVILEGEKDDDLLNSVQLEARFIAKKIKELKNNKFLVCDKKKVRTIDENGDVKEEQITYYRPVENKDFVILLSSHKNISSVYQTELSSLGIDCYAETGGYFEKNEITMALSLLKTVNNPYNDLSLISVMRLPIFGFSDDELCEIKLCGGNKFYDCVKNASIHAKAELKNKCIGLLQNIEKWRRYKKIMPCDKLIWLLYQETGLYSFCESLYGEDAASNLRLLFMRAKNFENSGYKGLFNFIRYIGKMQKREEDLSSAATLGENSDVVRIMTIHKSKGLEFPVVFLARCSKEFNLSDARSKILWHKELGFGANYIDCENSFYGKTLQKNALIIKINNELVSEEMRKLYVAMTRAKEKLFVTAVLKKKNSDEFSKNIPSEYNKWISSINNDGKISEIYAKSSTNYINWIAPVAITDRENWVFNIVPYPEASQIDLVFGEEDILKETTDNKILTISDGSYEFKDSTIIPSKISVTQINDIHKNFVVDLVKKPGFLNKNNTVGGAQRGTAIHYIMQKFIPFDNMSEKDVKLFIQSLVENGELTVEEGNSVDPSLITDFYSSDIGKRILRSDRVFREASFEIEVPLNQITDINSDEKIILQGIIDCYFYEDDKVVLVDYKSDFYDDIDEIKEKYRQQIQLYSLAIEKITKKSIKNQFLYLFSSKTVIEY